MSQAEIPINTDTSESATLYYVTPVSDNSEHCYDRTYGEHNVRLTTTQEEKNIHTHVFIRGQSAMFEVSSGVKELNIKQLCSNIEMVTIAVSSDLDVIIDGDFSITFKAMNPGIALRVTNVNTDNHGIDIYLRGTYTNVYIRQTSDTDSIKIHLDGTIYALYLAGESLYHVYLDNEEIVNSVGKITGKNFKIGPFISTIW